MKKNTVQIVVAPGLSPNSMLMGQYSISGKVKTLTMNGDVLNKSLAYTDIEKRFMMDFSKHNPSLNYNFDWSDVDKDDAASDINMGREKAIIDFWANHPLVKPTFQENPNLKGAPNFIMSIKESNENKLYDDIITAIEISNAFLDMKLSEQRDMCYYFGGNPTEMSPEQLVIDMIDFNSGRILKTENRDKFLLVADTKTDKVNIEIETRRAIATGVITKNDGNYFLPSGTQIGKTEKDCIMYMNANHNDLKYITEQAKQADETSFDKLESAQKDSGNLQSLRARAKELKVGGAYILDKDKLEFEIAKAEVKLAKR